MKEQQFEIIWHEPKGKNFEDLVGKILKEMFPNIIFEQTDYVHDGGKDFYSIGVASDEKIWVEAKNYKEHLELSKFSNTFIMADISEINRIIIFSLSEMTSGAKNNIARYSAYHKKMISVYAGTDFLVLLRIYINKFDISEFIKNHREFCEFLKTNPLETKSKIAIKYEYYHAKQFNLAYRRDADNHISERKVIDNLPLNSLLAQEIYITNSDFFQYKAIDIDYFKYDNVHIESYFYGEKPFRILVPPSSCVMLIVFFKVMDIYGTFELPTLGFDNIKPITENNTSYTECCWLGEIPYMGKGWEILQQAINDLNSNLNKNFLIIKGKSGVGKTRFLQELSGYYYRNAYRIISLDFRTITDLSLKAALQNIFDNIYMIDAGKNKGDDFNESCKDFYHIIYDSETDCHEHVETISTWMIELFNRKRILLLIDNAQDLGAEASNFFETLMLKVNNQSTLSSSIVMCFNEDYLFEGKATTKMLLHLQQLNRCYLIDLYNFTLDDAKLYLKECLDPRGLRSDLAPLFDQIITQFGTNPLVLKHLMLYLKQCNIINFIDSVTYVTNYEQITSALNALPEGILKILQYRYEHLLRNNISVSSQELDRIIWSILFLGALKETFVKKLSLDRNDLRLLLDYGFIEYNDKSELVFCHQLIEKSFCVYFLHQKYISHPILTMLDDDTFLINLYEMLKKIGKINYCIELMLLKSYLEQIDTDTFDMALRRIEKSAPRAIMIKMIINTITDCLNAGIKVDPALEFKAAYTLSIATQERFDVFTASKYTEDLVIYEQETFQEKLSAKREMIVFFKNYVFQLPIEQKYSFLDWMLLATPDFELPDDEFHVLNGWIHNRYSKNLCSQHLYKEAECHIKKSLKISLEQGDMCSAAEAEIEYGNIFAYNNGPKTVLHWKKCTDYIRKSGNESNYFKIYELGYDCLCMMIEHQYGNNLSDKMQQLQELRPHTFLYQQLFIDDVCINGLLLSYLDEKQETEYIENAVKLASRMKADSYLHTPGFTILATYKLLIAYCMLDNVDKRKNHSDIIKSLVMELIKSNIFEDQHLPYSEMVLYDISTCCKGPNNLKEVVLHELPQEAKKLFEAISHGKTKKQVRTIISDKEHQINLPHFNYSF